MVCTCFLCLIKSRRTEKVGDTRTITANKWLGVHFETKEAAFEAINKVNGMMLNDKKVFV